MVVTVIGSGTIVIVPVIDAPNVTVAPGFHSVPFNVTGVLPAMAALAGLMLSSVGSPQKLISTGELV